MEEKTPEAKASIAANPVKSVFSKKRSASFVKENDDDDAEDGEKDAKFDLVRDEVKAEMNDNREDGYVDAAKKQRLITEKQSDVRGDYNKATPMVTLSANPAFVPSSMEATSGKITTPNVNEEKDAMQVEEVPPIHVHVEAASTPTNDTEVHVVGTTNAMELPHMRHHCPVHKFLPATELPTDTGWYPHAAKWNKLYCGLCYCFVCDIPASRCTHWSNGDLSPAQNHCNASDDRNTRDSRIWKGLRYGVKRGWPMPVSTSAASKPAEAFPHKIGDGPFHPSDQKAASNPYLTQCRYCKYYNAFEHLNYTKPRTAATGKLVVGSTKDWCQSCGRLPSEKLVLHTPKSCPWGGGSVQQQQQLFHTKREITFRIESHDPREISPFRERWESEAARDPSWLPYDAKEMDHDNFWHRFGTHPTVSMITESLPITRHEHDDNNNRQCTVLMDGRKPIYRGHVNPLGPNASEKVLVHLDKAEDRVLLEEIGYWGQFASLGKRTNGHTGPIVAGVCAYWNREDRTGRFIIWFWLHKNACVAQPSGLWHEALAFRGASLAHTLRALFGLQPFPLVDLLHRNTVVNFQGPFSIDGVRDAVNDELNDKEDEGAKERISAVNKVIQTRGGQPYSFRSSSWEAAPIFGGVSSNDVSWDGMLRRFFSECLPFEIAIEGSLFSDEVFSRREIRRGAQEIAVISTSTPVDATVDKVHNRAPRRSSAGAANTTEPPGSSSLCGRISPTPIAEMLLKGSTSAAAPNPISSNTPIRGQQTFPAKSSSSPQGTVTGGASTPTVTAASRSASATPNDLATGTSGRTSGAAQSPAAEAAEKKRRKEQFLTYLRVLMKYVEQKDRAIHREATVVIKECAAKHRSGDPNYANLTTSLMFHVRRVVGDVYWRKAEEYLRHILKRQKRASQSDPSGGKTGVAGAESLSTQLARRPCSFHSHMRREDCTLLKRTNLFEICARVRKQTETFPGLLSHLENLGHRAVAEVPGLNVELFEFQRQAVQFAIERENVPGGIQRLWWTALPQRMRDGYTKIYYSPVLDKVRVGAPRVARGGIIAQEMGLGKTIIALALLLSNPAPAHPASGTLTRGFKADNEGVGWSSRAAEKRDNPERASIFSRGTLVVCNVSLVGQWVDEAKSKLKDPGLVYSYYGSNRKRNPQFLSKCAIVVTTYQTLSSDATYHAKKADSNTYCAPLEQIYWYRVVIDESHTCRHQSLVTMKVLKIEGENKWAVSGTPINTSVNDLRNQLKFIGIEHVDAMFDQFQARMPGLAGDVSRTEKDQFKGTLNAGPFFFLMRSLLIRHSMKQKTADGARDLVKLPSKEEHLITIAFSEEERKAYDLLESKAQKVYNTFKKSPRSVRREYLRIMAALQPLRMACSGGKLTARDQEEKKDHNADEYQMSGDEEMECCVCLETLESPVATLCHPVPHIYCRECITGVLSMADGGHGPCPICRGDVQLRSLRPAIPHENNDIGGELGMTSDFIFRSKLDRLLVELGKIRDEEPRAKSLVFTQFQSTLDWLKEELPKNGFKYRTLSGSQPMSQRAKALRDFQNDPPTTVFLLSLRAGAVGINLTQANRVFILEPAFNPALEAQAIGRVHRLGQTNDVKIIRLRMDTSVESRLATFVKRKYGGGEDKEKEGGDGDGADSFEISLFSLIGSLCRDEVGEKTSSMESDLDLLFGC